MHSRLIAVYSQISPNIIGRPGPAFTLSYDFADDEAKAFTVN